MRCLGTWFAGGLGSASLTVGLYDLKCLLQPKRVHDSIILNEVLLHFYLGLLPKGG